MDLTKTALALRYPAWRISEQIKCAANRRPWLEQLTDVVAELPMDLVHDKGFAEIREGLIAWLHSHASATPDTRGYLSRPPP
ncbi:hypothetical protein H7J06_18385 [Mycobacterium hodleri]|uniref:hypothetical protein n=1 Tax=Mycolicibacterium hodleri TaxID=49897 RepID=UPI0021F3AC18|nr:hypothetical protein [Mycolicibacterium hodleri]MCV7134952.1 hypothetical protein [Mycolicibacterium hodleri]